MIFLIVRTKPSGVESRPGLPLLVGKMSATFTSKDFFCDIVSERTPHRSWKSSAFQCECSSCLVPPGFFIRTSKFSVLTMFTRYWLSSARQNCQVVFWVNARNFPVCGKSNARDVPLREVQGRNAGSIRTPDANWRHSAVAVFGVGVCEICRLQDRPLDNVSTWLWQETWIYTPAAVPCRLLMEDRIHCLESHPTTPFARCRAVPLTFLLLRLLPAQLYRPLSNLLQPR